MILQERGELWQRIDPHPPQQPHPRLPFSSSAPSPSPEGSSPDPGSQRGNDWSDPNHSPNAAEGGIGSRRHGLGWAGEDFSEGMDPPRRRGLPLWQAAQGSTIPQDGGWPVPRQPGATPAGAGGHPLPRHQAGSPSVASDASSQTGDHDFPSGAEPSTQPAARPLFRTPLLVEEATPTDEAEPLTQCAARPAVHNPHMVEEAAPTAAPVDSDEDGSDSGVTSRMDIGSYSRDCDGPPAAAGTQHLQDRAYGTGLDLDGDSVADPAQRERWEKAESMLATVMQQCRERKTNVCALVDFIPPSDFADIFSGDLDDESLLLLAGDLKRVLSSCSSAISTMHCRFF